MVFHLWCGLHRTLDFLAWGYIKFRVYNRKENIVSDLRNHIRKAAYLFTMNIIKYLITQLKARVCDLV